MKIVADVADAVAAMLASQTFSQSFTPERSHMPAFTLEDAQSLKVLVAPKGVSVSRIARGMFRHDVQINVGVIQQVNTDSAVTVDALMQVVQEVVRAIEDVAITVGGAVGALTGIENDPIYDPESFRERRLFFSIVTATYAVVTRV